MNAIINYFQGDTMSADVWVSKYQMKDQNGNPLEETPTDMHMRLAKEFARIEYQYYKTEDLSNRRNLSQFGRKFIEETINFTEKDFADLFFNYFDHFKYIVPQGSIMSNLGNDFVFGSLSNCFGIAPPNDSYGSILRADQELVQLMKRRGGVGTTLNNLRPSGTAVTNAAKTSSGAYSFAERFSNSTREVAQEGRRGALMLLMHVAHPDIFKFIRMKADRTKVTGANISVMFTDEFLKCVEKDEDFLCTFPVGLKGQFTSTSVWSTGNKLTRVLNPQFDLEYNSLTSYKDDSYGNIYLMRIKAKELFGEFVSMAWDNAEPGAAYIDRIIDYSPDGVYEAYIPELCNPCGEQWFHRYDTCRLIALNLFSIIDNPFSVEARVDLEKLYEVSYIQQRLGDNLVDLEAEYIDKILNKLNKDIEGTDEDQIEEARVEINLWSKIKDIALAGRRTGNGFTGLGDMIAAMGYKYDSEVSLSIIETVMKVKMEAELDATIDMAILRGTFEGWEVTKEFACTWGRDLEDVNDGKNSFFQMIRDEFPEQAKRMAQYGRRNVSWSTVAPTGTVSIMTQTTGGLEPLFKGFYIRRKKVNPGDIDTRVDFTDQNGDKWQEYPVMHPKFKMWLETTTPDIDWSSVRKEHLQAMFEVSPYYGSEADDISWEKRIEIQAIIQKYTSNAISSTINLPTDVPKEVVYNIYFEAWKKGLKGVTIYRDGSRTGVLVNEKKITTQDTFGYNDSIKRPDVLEADYYCVTANGIKYAVAVGLLNNNPYELFAFENPLCENPLKGQITKVSSGVYSFSSPNYTIENLQLSSERTDERLLTRWVSLLLRHGSNPKFIAEQVEKSEVTITSFGKVVARVLKNYIPDEQIKGELCPECSQPTLVYQEGCKKCTNCGNSKC